MDNSQLLSQGGAPNEGGIPNDDKLSVVYNELRDIKDANVELTKEVKLMRKRNTSNDNGALSWQRAPRSG